MNIAAPFPSASKVSFGLWPRQIGVLATLLSVGGLMAYSVSQQKPVGRVHGRVLLSENHAPLAKVRVTLTPWDESDDDDTINANPEASGEGVRRIRAVTDANGEFELAHLEVGNYHISAATRAHAVDETSIWVSEDETTDVPLQLKRSEPDLKVTQQQNEFLPAETVVLPVQGYVDGKKAAGQDALTVRVFKTRLSNVLGNVEASRALGQVSDQYSPIVSLPPALLHPSSGAIPQLVSTSLVPLKGADIEGFFHERLKLGTPGPGLFLVDVRHGKNTVCAQMMVSDTALVVKKTRDQLLAYAVDSQSGSPRPGAAVQVFQSGKTLAKARTDRQGLARITLKSEDGERDGGRLLTLVSTGSSEATVGQYDYSGEDESHGEFTVHAYTDRPLYRPGGHISYKGIVRRTIDTGIRYSVPNGQAVDVEVHDPSGERVAQAHLKTNTYGSFHGAFDLSSEAPTGNYSIVMTLDEEEHTSDFNVVAYRKPEFSATVTPNEKHYAFGDNVEMVIASTYYFGAPVAGAKAHYVITRAPDWASYFGDEDDTTDPTDTEYGNSEEGQYSDDSGEMVTEGDATLDANGHAIIRFAGQPKDKDKDEGDTSDSEISDEPQNQIYTAQVSITDASQREIEASGQVPITAGDFQLSAQTDGYFATPDKATTVRVIATDFEGHPIAGKALELVTDYHPEGKAKGGDATRRYQSTTDAKGVASITLTPSKEGVLYLQATAQDDQKRDIVATRSLWIAGDAGGDFDAQYNALSVLTDKKRYDAGETAKVLLNSEQSGGTALLTVEGSKLFRAWLVPLAHKSTAFKVPIASDYGPNVTLVACMVRGKKFASSEAPLRVVVPQRTIKVAVQSDRQKYQPGDKVTYQVQTTDQKGKPIPAELSFGVVDEAIYALQEDDPTALRSAFYPQNPNSVETGYSFEPLYLGDVNKSEPTIEARRKFMDTAFWQPDLRTDAQGHASVSFALPDNLTTWRATAVAQTLDTAFGRRTQQIIVAKDFFVRLETPRFFTAGDETRLLALVHNESGQAQDATVRLEADGLKLSGQETQPLHIESGAVGQIVWPVATDKVGLGFINNAHLKLSAWTSPSDGAARLTDAVETTVPVRPHGRERIDNFVGQIASNGVFNQPIALDAASIPAASRVTVRITPSVSDALVGALPSLIGFPYGCTEQTMSRFLPDILVQRTLRLKGLQNASSQKLVEQLPQMVRDSLTRLGRFQHDSGGWGWWETDDDDPWMTAYVLYGLSLAKAEGYEVNDDMVSRGREAAAKMLEQKITQIPAWQRANWQNTRAFLMYSLALAQPKAEEMKLVAKLRASTQTSGLEPQALSYLTLLDKKLNGSGTAWLELEKQLTLEGHQMSYWEGSGLNSWSDWDDKTSTAMGLRAMVANDPTDPRIPSIILWLMTHREDDSWSSTRDTSWVLNALCDYLDSKGGSEAAKPGSLEVQLNQKLVQNVTLKSGQQQGEMVFHLPWNELRSSFNSLSLKRIGGGEPIFYAIQIRQTVGSDQPLPAVSSSVPIKISREYRRLVPLAAGDNNWKLQSTPSNNQLNQGDRVRVRLTFEVPSDLSYVLIEDAFPSGCEVTERGSADEGNEDWDNWWSDTDVRDDRIAFFARHMSRGKHTIEYNLRAQTPGEYRALPTLLQAMYAPEVRAETAETVLSIKATQ